MTTVLTARVLGATQIGDEVVPERCSKCGAQWTSVSPREAHCLLCGTMFIRFVGVIGTPAHPALPTHPAHHKVKPSGN